MSNDQKDTDRVPSDPQARLAHDLAELRLATANVYACLERVSTSICRVELCELTVEHRQNVQREKIGAGGRWLVDLERRVRVLEGLGDVPTAAE